MKAQINNFQHTLSHGLGVIKNCSKEGNYETTNKFQTIKDSSYTLVTKDGIQDISSAISTVMGKHMGSLLPSSPKKKKTPTPLMTADPNNTAPPTEVSLIMPLAPMLQPTVTTVHMTASSPTITAQVPQPTSISCSTLPEEALLQRPMSNVP
jgi:hypothetical protein